MVSSTAYLACGSSDDKNGTPTGGASNTSGGTSGGSDGTGGRASGANGGVGASSGEGPGSGGDGPAGGAGDTAGAGGSAPGGGDGTGGVPANAGAGSSGDAGSGAVGGETGGGDVGVVTFDTFAFYRPALISDADGVLHMVFNTNTSPSEIHYARCAADCGVGANWEVTIVSTHQFSGMARLVAGSDKRLHLLYDVSTTGGAAQLIYATCASNCTQPASWTKTDLASLFGGGWDSPTSGSPLVIDAQNRLSFTVDRKIYTNGGVSLATCASNCSTLSNWSAGTISATGTRTSLAARGTTLYQLIDNATGSATGNALGYRTCAANCTQAASWEALSDVFVYDGAMPNAIAVTAEGGVRVVYNQGQSASSQTAPVKAQDNQLLVWGCDADCLDVASWSGFVMGAAGDGKDGLAMAELGGALVLSVSNGDRVLARYCGADCLVDSSWREADIDTIAALTSEYDPFTRSAASCSGPTNPQAASWNLTQGVVAIRPDASLAFAHTASILRTCPASTSVGYLPGFGRLVFVP